jgi:ABC-type amino acid transport substrate-binding protein
MTQPQASSSFRRVRRLWLMVALASVMALILGGCGIPSGAGGGGGGGSSDDTSGTSTTFASNSTMGKIRDRGYLLVGVRWNAAPFAFQNSSTGAASGMDVDLVNQIATVIFGSTDIEGKIHWVPLDPLDNELALEQNRVDIVVGRYQITVARKNLVDFAGPYLADPQSILVSSAQQLSADGQEFQAPGDFNGQKICWVTGSTDIAAFQALAPSANTSDQRSSLTQCGVDLANGLVSGVVASRVDELQYMKNTSNAQMLDSTWDPALYGIGLKKGVSDLRSFLNDQITAFDYDTSYSTWISGSGDLPQPAVDRY